MPQKIYKQLKFKNLKKMNKGINIKIYKYIKYIIKSIYKYIKYIYKKIYKI